MSKNISIKVGGVSRNFSNVPKIQTEEAVTGDTINWIPEDEANDYAVTETLRITQNGTYHPSSGKCGFSEVVANVSGGGGGGTLIEKTITANGDYYAVDDNADGYSKVSVNVATPINSVTKEEFDEMTFEERKALGFIIIRNNDAQMSGDWYDYSQATSFLLPYSDFENIIVYSEQASFDGANPWGIGRLKVNYNSTVVYDSENFAVKIHNLTTNPKAEGVIDLQDISPSNIDMTVYAVCSCDYCNTGNGAIISVFSEYNSHRHANIGCDYGQNYRLRCGTFNDDAFTNIYNTQGKFFVCAIKFNATSGYAKFFIDEWTSENLAIDKTARFRYIHLAIGMLNTYATNSSFKFVGVVRGTEDNSVIVNNMEQMRLCYGLDPISSLRLSSQANNSLLTNAKREVDGSKNTDGEKLNISQIRCS